MKKEKPTTLNIVKETLREILCEKDYKNIHDNCVLVATGASDVQKEKAFERLKRYFPGDSDPCVGWYDTNDNIREIYWSWETAPGWFYVTGLPAYVKTVKVMDEILYKS